MHLSILPFQLRSGLPGHQTRATEIQQTVHKPFVSNRHGYDDVQERIVVVRQRQLLRHLTSEVFEKDLIDFAVNATYKLRELGRYPNLFGVSRDTKAEEA